MPATMFQLKPDFLVGKKSTIKFRIRNVNYDVSPPEGGGLHIDFGSSYLWFLVCYNSNLRKCIDHIMVLDKFET